VAVTLLLQVAGLTNASYQSLN